jgi:putative DNA primase/helicase
MGKPYTTAVGKLFYRIKPCWEPIEDIDEKPKYLSPMGEGNKPYFAPTYTQWEKTLRTNKRPIIITEGEKKAALLGLLGYAAIGLSGVQGWKDKTVRTDELEEIPAQFLEDYEDRDKELNQLENSRPLPELDSVNGVNIWKHRKVYLTFDSEINHKWQVKNALSQLAEWLKSKGAEPYIVILPTEINGDKNGVDDFVVRHGKESLEKILEASEPAFEYSKGKPILNLQVDPALALKSILLWSALKDHWRYRPGIGWHNWTGTHWQLKDDGIGTYIDQDIYAFMRANKWQRQESGSLSNFLRSLRSDLLVEKWNPKSKIAFQNGVLDFDAQILSIKTLRCPPILCLFSISAFNPHRTQVISLTY